MVGLFLWLDKLRLAVVILHLSAAMSANPKADSTMIRTIHRVWQRFAAPRHTLPLTPGIYVVAKNQRQANWLWGLAVEQHVSSALMTQIAADNSRRSQPSYQLHLLP